VTIGAVGRSVGSPVTTSSTLAAVDADTPTSIGVLRAFTIGRASANTLSDFSTRSRSSFGREPSM
jgi:hypothetical protein